MPHKRFQCFDSLPIMSESFNSFSDKPWFSRDCSTSLLKTQSEKEELLVTSNFSFSHSISNPLENVLPFSSNSKLSSANSCSMEASKFSCLGNG